MQSALLTMLQNKFPNTSEADIKLILEQQGILEKLPSLPKELQGVITQKAILSSNNIKEVVENIKKFSEVYGVKIDTLFDNLKDFTKLVHILGDKFDTSPQVIAVYLHWDTPTAQKYQELYQDFVNALYHGSIEDVKRLIAEGADIVAVSGIICRTLKYLLPMGEPAAEKIKLLLKHGANPYDYSIKELINMNKDRRLILLECLNKYRDAPEYEQIKALLEEAMKNYQQ